MTRGLPEARFAVLAKRPGRRPVVCSVPQLQTEEQAQQTLARLFGDPELRSEQYALAELTIVEMYR